MKMTEKRIRCTQRKNGMTAPKGKKIKYGELNNQFLATLNWAKTIDTLQSDEFTKMWSLCTQSLDDDFGTYEQLHPMILGAKANSEDNPTWEEAMNGPLADGYWKAAEKEIQTLQDMDVWDVVERREDMNVLPGTWAFKCKRFPDGSVRKLKGRFCCRGDRQIDGVDFDSQEIFSPVMAPGQYTPRSKHYAIKYHWFRSHLHPTRTTIMHIESQYQKADILTKGLTVEKFRQIRKLLCGW